jgi:TetR/AcrR family transcriptional repressor of lmrAB and yxaGH operons
MNAAAPVTRPEKAAATRQRIVEDATRLFQQRGFHGVGVADLAGAANVPKGVLYYHFPGGKGAIAAAALAQVCDAALKRGTAMAQAGLSGAEMIAAIADATAIWMAKTHWRESSILVALSVDLNGADSALQDQITAAYRALREVLASAWRSQGMNAERAESLACAAISALEGATILARAERSPAPLQAVARAFAACAP